MEITVSDFVQLLWKSCQRGQTPIFAAANICVTEGTDPSTANTNCKGGQTPLLSSQITSNISVQNLLHYGHLRGWLEDQDESFPGTYLNKRTAARILHQFIKLELGVPDLPDIKPAEVLQDLYTCRACANHVAQVYIREFMSGEEIEINGKICFIFNMLQTVSKEEAEIIISKMLKIYHK